MITIKLHNYEKLQNFISHKHIPEANFLNKLLFKVFNTKKKLMQNNIK